MKPYGLPRNHDAEDCDLADIQLYGRKSSKSRIASKSGDIKNSFRSTKSKAATRRIWKKKARAKFKKDIKNDLE